jgi:2-dehydro-3-deoxyphosphogluconate aldolase/(4S)-4-hydroxy-2-oxoglutarate aldolase
MIMSSRFETLAILHESRLTAVVRGVPRGSAEALGRALTAGGISCIEVTLNTPGALEMIAILAAVPGVLVGAGTVLDAEGAAAAIRAGARFVVSPGLNVDVIRTCHRWGVAAVPGALTPTEIMAAAEAGGDLIKVFPAGTLGPRYFKELSGPLSHIDLMATGGIAAANAGEFLGAGVKVVAVGGNLVDPKLVAEGRWAELQRRAEELVAAVQT